MVYYPMAEKKYWKISRGVMVIPRKNIEFSSEEPKAPRKKIQYFSKGLPSPRVIFSNTFFQPQGNNNHFLQSDALYTKPETYLLGHLLGYTLNFSWFYQVAGTFTVILMCGMAQLGQNMKATVPALSKKPLCVT